VEKETRNAIYTATQKARSALEKDYAEQLQADYDVMRDGRVGDRPSPHLTGPQRALRARVTAAIEHKRAQGMTPKDAVADYLRDAAFTTLNRFVALKMLEARGLVQECVSKGEASSGFTEFCSFAPGLKTPDGSGYRLYIECLFDELSTEVKVLFDRRDAASALWPKRTTFLALLEIFNAADLASVWGEDETIGWVYQYFNGQDERRKMRKSQAPRNSRELAVRNQFFTPRYVVQFLTDNTLGRIWYEMRDADTVLTNTCEHMIHKAGEEIAPRVKKDPRDLRVLDPACGSGHFMLYAFDLLLAIYEEAYADPESPTSEATGRTLAQDYPTLDTLKKALPGLILAHNLHGVDIDPRCAQIAQLALWMRAQRAFGEFKITRADRPMIKRANIVIAEPMPGEKDLLQDFLAGLKEERLEDIIRRALQVPEGHKVRATKAMADSLAELVTTVWEGMKLADEMGTLLKIERDIARAIEKGRAEWDESLPLFRVTNYSLGSAKEEKLVKVAADEDEDFWTRAEKLVFQALADYVAAASAAGSARRRLFAEDAAQGFALADLVAKGFDSVVMNPPFGEMTAAVQIGVDYAYPEARNDIYAAFVRRATELAARSKGRVGAITSRAFVTGRDHRNFRRSLLNDPQAQLSIFVDLGGGILDGAMVETAAFIVAPSEVNDKSVICFLDARGIDRAELATRLLSIPARMWPRTRFLRLPNSDLVYDLDEEAFEALAHDGETFEPAIGRVTFGLTTKDDFRFVRLRWEISAARISKRGPWTPFSKGGEYAWFTANTHLVVKQGVGAKEIAAFAELCDGNIASTRRSSSYYFTASVRFSRRSQRGFSARRLRPNACFSDKTAVIVPRETQSDWLYALPPILASQEYQRLIAAQSKFGSYEIGPIKNLPVPVEAAVAQKSFWMQIYKYFDEIEAFDETSETFCGLPDQTWSPSRNWPGARKALVDGLAACGLLPDTEVMRQLELWVAERERRYDFETMRRSWALGVVFGRFDDRVGQQISVGAFSEPGSDILTTYQSKPTDILVDDRNHDDDILLRILNVMNEVQSEELREWIGGTFWIAHVSAYSRSRRSAPIYWQLATPSASYSVWLYIHTFTKDTLYRVQNDYAAPKLAQEERALEALKREIGIGGTGAQRKAVAAQETFVEELRTFLEEVKRVAPLWNPDLDDGVIINFAPLWRLVPQHKAWQKEVKATWDALCEGKYDWAHLAMHLWPERVVPKCATDRSLAIAHGLEDFFWFEDAGGKWKARSVPTRPTEALVAERSSEAVKAALKSLTDAPDHAGPAKRGRKSARA
jgi:hypothetical protein